MKRLSEDFFRPLIDGAPLMVIPFGKGQPRIIPRKQLAEVKSGIITMSPIACFYQQCGFIWDRLNELARSRAQIRAWRAEALRGA